MLGQIQLGQWFVARVAEQICYGQSGTHTIPGSDTGDTGVRAKLGCDQCDQC